MSELALTTVNLHVVESKRDELARYVFQPLTGQQINVDLLAGSLLERLPDGVRYDTIFESIRYLAGQELTEVEGMRAAWRLAGNLKRLKEGHAVPPWAMQRDDEWVPLQVLRVQKSRNQKDVIGCAITVRAMAGTPAPLKITHFWGSKIARFVSGKIGFSAPWGKYPFKNVEDLVGLRFYGLVEAARSREKPEFHEVACTDSMCDWNRKQVLKLRLRVGMKCPANFDHACHLCPYGYDRCTAAVHALTFTAGPCANCGNQQAAFDPENTSPHCVMCAEAFRMRRRNQ